tara:strand:- start:9008 stop:9481 length:474 start_codon:yes stop_codon:yes gene_type:complete
MPNKFIGSRLAAIYEYNSAAAGGKRVVTFGVTGFSISGGDRTMIDATTGADDRRQVLAGLAEPLTATVNFIYEADNTGQNITALDESLETCSSGTLVLRTATDFGDCALTTIIGSSADPPEGVHVYLNSYSVEAELDGIVTGTAEFTKLSAAVPSPS